MALSVDPRFCIFGLNQFVLGVLELIFIVLKASLIFGYFFTLSGLCWCLVLLIFRSLSLFKSSIPFLSPCNVDNLSCAVTSFDQPPIPHCEMTFFFNRAQMCFMWLTPIF